MTADIAQISARSTYFTQSLDKSTFLYMYKTGIPITTDIPTAMGACSTYDDLTILDFSNNAEDNFDVSEGDINIGISVVKGNTTLLDAMNAVLSGMTVEDMNQIMNEAIAVQPAI